LKLVWKKEKKRRERERERERGGGRGGEEINSNSLGLSLDKDERKVKTLFLEILSGLRYIHEEKKKIHCDLKPANIFIRFEKIVIGDFGLTVDCMIRILMM
jgi:serine/threonine protein kinase